MKFNSNLKIKSFILDPISVISVLFLFVVFFVLCTQYLGAKGTVLDLPNIDQAELYRLDSMVAVLDGDRIVIAHEEVDMKTLQSILAGKLPQLLAIKAEKNTSYSRVAEVISVAKKVGIKQIALASNEK